MRDDSAEILFQSFRQKAVVSSSVMDRDVHFSMLSIQHFLRRLRRRLLSKVLRRTVLERLSWPVTCLNHASFRLLTVARRGSRGPAKKLCTTTTVLLTLSTVRHDLVGPPACHIMGYNNQIGTLRLKKTLNLVVSSLGL